MPILPSKGLFRVVLVALLTLVILILAILILFGYPLLRTSDNLNIFLTFALVFFAFVEASSTIFQARIEKKRKQTVDLRNELGKLYGPVYSVLNNVVCVEVKNGILTQSERKLLDETFSKEPFILRDSQMEWKLKIRNLPIKETADNDIPMKFIEYFNKEYERRKNGNDAIEKQFCDIYSMFKNVPQKVEEVGVLLPDEKTLIDKKFSTYPFMLNQELYDYWNKEIRSLKITIGYEAFEHKITLLEHLEINEEDVVQKTLGVYSIPKVFITKFLKEYDNKVNEFNKL